MSKPHPRELESLHSWQAPRTGMMVAWTMPRNSNNCLPCYTHSQSCWVAKQGNHDCQKRLFSSKYRVKIPNTLALVKNNTPKPPPSPCLKKAKKFHFTVWHHLETLTLHKTSTGVDIFFSLIFSYFCFFVAACGTCKSQYERYCATMD